MKINKKSIHYRFNLLMSECLDNMPKTVCSYFWCTITNIFLLIFAFVIVCGFGVIAFSPLIAIFFQNDFIKDIYPGGIAIDIGTLLCVVLPFLFSQISFGRVIIQYARAIKNKICPLIEYEGKPE